MGGSALGRRLPKGALEEKETRGDKGREGTLKNENLGRRLLWMVPKYKHFSWEVFRYHG